MMATSLLVVPRSMPRIISDMIIPLMFAVCPQVTPDAEPSRPVFVQRTYQLSLKHVTVYFCLALQRCITHAVLCNAMQRSFGVRGARMFEYHRGRMPACSSASAPPSTPTITGADALLQ